MKTSFASSFMLIALLFTSCSSSVDTELVGEDPPIIDKSFTEGTIEMGIFSHDVDLGKLIGKMDFSKPNIKEQYMQLVENDKESKAIFQVLESIGKQNPLAGFAAMLNISECTYYIKDDVVLGNARGFGWTMDNYHNKGEDKASLYLETLVQTDKIAQADRKIYSLYTPSTNAGANAVNDLDLSLFNREAKKVKQNISGYECDVIVYTPKVLDEDTPMQLQKLEVYTSSQFSNTINFTHPFYLAEDGGILKLDIYYIDTKTPTLTMKPKAIQAKTLSAQDMQSRTAEPVYTGDDINWAFKALAVMMSGWGQLED